VSDSVSYRGVFLSSSALPTATPIVDYRIRQIMILIESRFNQHFSQLYLARTVNLSPWRLCHLFKSETGVAPLQYLKTVRMEKAKQLLETTCLSVKQIMKIVGIKDESHFVRDFQRFYGVSPSSYREHANHKGLSH